MKTQITQVSRERNAVLQYNETMLRNRSFFIDTRGVGRFFLHRITDQGQKD